MDEINSILITGGAGYVGYTIIESLSRRYPSAKLIVFDNFSKGKADTVASLMQKVKNLEIIPWEKADIRDSDNLEAVLKECHPDIVINLAAIVDAFTTNREGKDRECEIVNYESAVSLANLSKKYGAKMFIQQSTVSIYSSGEDINEESEKKPLSMYAKAKLRAEHDILKLNENSFKVIVLRPATVVGYNPAFRYETIINLICVRSVFKIPIRIFESALYGNKTYLDVQDNARAIIFAIENSDKMAGDYFNISSFNTNLNNVLEIVRRVLKEDFIYNMVHEKSINQQVYTINSDKIKSLGFKPLGDLESIIRHTLNELKKRREFFQKQA